MNSSNNDDGLDDFKVDDGECKVNLCDVVKGGGDSNDDADADDVGGVDTNDGDDANYADGNSKLLMVMN